MTASIHHTAAHANCARKPQSLFGHLSQMIAKTRQRRQLLALDDHLLKDIGVTRAQALKEGRQTLWNAPSHWRK